ncbi:hypothetical protein ACLOJK_024132, partial [Asimina triloba]
FNMMMGKSYDNIYQQQAFANPAARPSIGQLGGQAVNIPSRPLQPCNDPFKDRQPGV